MRYLSSSLRVSSSKEMLLGLNLLEGSSPSPYSTKTLFQSWSLRISCRDCLPTSLFDLLVWQHQRERTCSKRSASFQLLTLFLMSCWRSARGFKYFLARPSLSTSFKNANACSSMASLTVSSPSPSHDDFSIGGFTSYFWMCACSTLFMFATFLFMFSTFFLSGLESLTGFSKAVICLSCSEISGSDLNILKARMHSLPNSCSSLKSCFSMISE
mmetsp:Transcript_27243/g.51428  ORF Transcript_27243/g.51428 Transcript_27243/m.51428 type:complete len:214 (-) Transcript_27243:1347-1988(-)